MIIMLGSCSGIVKRKGAELRRRKVLALKFYLLGKLPLGLSKLSRINVSLSLNQNYIPK